MSVLENFDWMLLPIAVLGWVTDAGITTKLIELMQTSIVSSGDLTLSISMLISVVAVGAAFGTNRIEVEEWGVPEIGATVVVVVLTLGMATPSVRDAVQSNVWTGGGYVAVLLLLFGYVAYAPVGDE